MASTLKEISDQSADWTNGYTCTHITILITLEQAEGCGLLPFL